MGRTIITGTGSCVPENIVENTAFHDIEFYDPSGEKIDSEGPTITSKFEAITGIRSRRYADQNQVNSDLAALAGAKAIKDANINPEDLDLLIVAQNFGDVDYGSDQVDMVPSIAARTKHKLGIKNPRCVAFDLIYGCPGWIQAMATAHAYFKAGLASKALIIGSETLSRVVDMHDRDSMIFADGAGAVVVENSETTQSTADKGILSISSVTHTEDEVTWLNYHCTNKPGTDNKSKYIKMMGRKIYEYAITEVPKALKECVENAGVEIGDLKKIFIHQANEKMDDAIIKRFFRLYGIKSTPENVVPMNIQEYGNSSVATVPTLFDEVLKGQYPEHQLESGDVILLASVGAGMGINAITYRMP